MVEKMKSRLLRFLYLKILHDRVAYARRLGAKVGERCQFLCDPSECLGSEPYLVTVGNHVEITAGVHFITHEGALWVARELAEELKNVDILQPIRVGNNVFIGNNAIIMPGVTIGDNVVIGAGSIVTRDVECHSIAAGVPARVISTLDLFMEKAKDRAVPTKRLSRAEKKAYVMRNVLKEEGRESNG